MIEVKNIAKADTVQELPDGSATLDTVRLGDMTVSKVTLNPGWSWEKNLKPLAGTETCQVPHNQIVAAGRIHVKMDDGTEAEAGPGDVIRCSPGHLAWVVGPEQVVAFDFGFGTTIADTVASAPDTRPPATAQR